MEIAALALLLLMPLDAVGSDLRLKSCYEKKPNCNNMHQEENREERMLFNILDHVQWSILEGIINETAIVEIWNGYASDQRCLKLKFCKAENGTFNMIEDIVHCKDIGTIDCLLQTDKCPDDRKHHSWRGPNCSDSTTMSTYKTEDVSTQSSVGTSENNAGQFGRLHTESTQKKGPIAHAEMVAIVGSIVVIIIIGIILVAHLHLLRKHRDKVIQTRCLDVRNSIVENGKDTNQQRKSLHEYSTISEIQGKSINEYSEIDLLYDHPVTEYEVAKIVSPVQIPADPTSHPCVFYHTLEKNNIDAPLKTNIDEFKYAVAKTISPDVLATDTTSDTACHTSDKAVYDVAKVIESKEDESSLQYILQNGANINASSATCNAYFTLEKIADRQQNEANLQREDFSAANVEYTKDNCERPKENSDDNDDNNENEDRKKSCLLTFNEDHGNEVLLDAAECNSMFTSEVVKKSESLYHTLETTKSESVNGIMEQNEENRSPSQNVLHNDDGNDVHLSNKTGDTYFTLERSSI